MWGCGMSAIAHPALATPSAQRGLVFALLVRVTLFASVIFGLDAILELGTSAGVLSVGAVVGILAATRLAFSRLSGGGFIAVLVGSVVLYRIAWSVVAMIGGLLIPERLTVFNVQTHGDLFALTALLSAVSTWGFWRVRHAITVEILLLGSSLIYLFSGHRNFRFDASGTTPQLINSLAWMLGIDHLSMLVVIGAAVAISLIVYGFLSTLPSRPLPLLGLVQTHPGSRNTVAASALTLSLAIALFVSGHAIYRYYDILAQ